MMQPNQRPTIVIDRAADTVTLSGVLAWRDVGGNSFIEPSERAFSIALPFSGSPFDPAFVAPSLAPNSAATLPGTATVTLGDPVGFETESRSGLEWGLIRVVGQDGVDAFAIATGHFFSLFPASGGLDGDERYQAYLVFEDADFSHLLQVYATQEVRTPLPYPILDFTTDNREGSSVFTPVVVDLLPTEGPDLLTGGDAGELLTGLGGDDVLNGMGGDDTLAGGAGADVLNGGEGRDWVDYSASPAGVQVDIGYDSAAGGDAEGDSFVSIEGVSATNHADGIGGGDGDDAIFTWWGDDWIWGRGGADRIDAGGHDDRVWGGDGADTLNGGLGEDTLHGGAGADALGGDGGDDWLSGDGGDDWLWGGAGADTFAFSLDALAWGGHDRIMDMDDAGDRLRLDGVRYDQLIWYEQDAAAVVQIRLDSGGSHYIEIANFSLAALADQYVYG